MALTQSLIRELAREAGFTLGGVAAVPDATSIASQEERERFAAWVDAGHAGEMDYLKRVNEQGDPLRSSVRAPFPWAKSVIVCVADYSSEHPRSIDPAPEGAAWIARYAWSGSQNMGEAQRPSDYHKMLLKRLKAIEARLQEQFGAIESRCYVDTGPIVERVYARYAGLGWTGKNTCLLNQQLGSWLFLGVIITSLEVRADELALPAADRCGSCTRCIDACPTQALTPYRMNATRCISYLTIEKRGIIPGAVPGDGGITDLREGIGRNVFGCDICQDVCPWNKKSAAGRAFIVADPELAPRTALINPALDWLASMSERDFGEWFYGSPVKRARFDGFRRNLAIAMGNSGLQRFLPQLREWARSAESGLSDAAEWAVRRLEGESTPDDAAETRTAP
ncbi:epoxyqueuosine reductase [Silvibacterium bohemicum]|uniref:Epoxyqueuosine reductase n=1 Tax=Silvibacterium bohemicum TaxID=1577686 RepID=A0A841JZU3_9BACT|nr:tRNA epoxyqueuosine(34) reductase QueG [Silvibacterium bohemicum]MBB6146670.1 epoxyqueuosine reductase [Silvibacterium bohemicum]